MVDLYYNTSAPQNLQDVAVAANEYTGFASLGILLVIWMVVFGSIHRRGYEAVSAMHSANFLTSIIGMVIFPFGLVSGTAVTFMFVLTAGLIAYSYLQGPR